ncbi:MAG: antirestriction protein ArdA [Acidimicrobiales bacterium]
MEQIPLPEEGNRIPTPNIYVASLSDYNDGRLHGSWIDASQSADELHAAVQGMLDHSPIGGAEEYAIHDYEGFGPWRPSEYESIEAVAAVANGIAEFGPAFAHYVALRGTEEDTLSDFEDHYLGHYESAEAYAEELLEDLGISIQVPSGFEPYVQLDVAAYARDLELGGDIELSEGDGGVYIFSA